MPLDRQAIEKRDFPIGRRGYDPAAVDAHLARLADEMDALGRQLKRRSGESLAQSASEQVRAIVQAAESSAEAIERSAEAEAAEIRGDATRDAERTRADAIERAHGHVGAVSGATSEMLKRVEGMQAELGALLESLRTGANRVDADLSLLESHMSELQAAAEGGSVADERHAEEYLPLVTEVEAFDARPAAAQAADEDRGAVPPAPAPPVEPVFRGGAEEIGDDTEGDVEGARLIALNMALSGQSREETDRYLAENFDLPDRRELLDDVYQSIGAG